MQQSLSRLAVVVAWQAFCKTKVKTGQKALKAGLADKFELLKTPGRERWRDERGTLHEEDVPDTGAGCEKWNWRQEGGAMDLSPAEADHLAEGHKAILEGDGYEAFLSAAVEEFDSSLSLWQVREAKEGKKV